MYRGYIRLWRKIDENPIALRPAYLSVWLFILRHANHKGKTIIWNNQKTMIKKGSFITSADKIAKGTGVPRGTVERILKYLENEVMIEEQTTKRFRLISVINYQDYQSSEEVNEEQVRNKRGTSEEQVDTTKNDKELRRMKKNEEGETPTQKMKRFLENPELPISALVAKGIPEELAKTELRKFISYWTELNKSGTKQRWEMEKTFEVGRRLATWFNNIGKFSKNTNKFEFKIL